MRITEDTTIGEILKLADGMDEVLRSMGMQCSTCPTAQRETLGQAADVHGLDVDDLIEDIKGFLEQ